MKVCNAVRAAVLTVLLSGVSGCAVVAVVDTAASVAVKGVGLAADAAIGTVKITGKAVGAAADAAFGDDEEEKAEE